MANVQCLLRSKGLRIPPNCFDGGSQLKQFDQGAGLPLQSWSA